MNPAELPFAEAPAGPAVSRVLHSGRSWTGHDVEDSCPCNQEACGLVDVFKADPDCTQHPIGRSKTMRQGHDADLCPAKTGDYIRAWDNGDYEESVAWGTHDPLLAAAAYRKAFLSGEALEEDAPDFSGARKRWGRPGLPGHEQWPAEGTSDIEVSGWIPYLVMDW